MGIWLDSVSINSKIRVVGQSAMSQKDNESSASKRFIIISDSQVKSKSFPILVTERWARS